MRSFLIASCTVCLSSGALANCENDARAAFARVTTSGPYRFEKLEWQAGKNVHLIGKLIPGYRMRCKYEDELREEYLDYKASDGFKFNNLQKDKFGWTGPFSFGWHEDIADVHHAFKIIGYNCLGQVDEGGRHSLVFQRTTQPYPEKVEEDRLFVDVESGLPLRRETSPQLFPNQKSVTTYSFDPSITIERPRINLKARWDASIKVFDQSVQASVPSCRQEVLEILDRGSSSQAFEYWITFDGYEASPNGITGFSGIFVPPNSIYQRWEGYSGHGAGNEVIAIADKFWLNSPYVQGLWVISKGPPPIWGQVSADWNAPITVDLSEYGRKHPRKISNHVGYASCATTLTDKNQTYVVYKYDVFRDARRERNLLAHRTMLVDPKTRLPVEFRDLLAASSFTAQERRRYDSSLKVEVPTQSYLSPKN